MLLEQRQFLVKERVAFAKLTDVFDIFDPVSGAQIGIARDEPPTWARYFRLLINKSLLPTTINIYEDENMPPVLVLEKAAAAFRPTIRVLDQRNVELGLFRSKLFSLGGGFFVIDSTGRQIAEVKGDWKGWNFRFLGEMGEELGVVTKKWAGAAKELFTSADNYVIALSDSAGRAAGGPALSALLLAAGLAIDIVFKEKR